MTDTAVADFARYRNIARGFCPVLAPYPLITRTGPEISWEHFLGSMPQYNVPNGFDVESNQQAHLVCFHEPGHEYEEWLRINRPGDQHRQRFLTLIGETLPWDTLKAIADAKPTSQQQHDADPGEWWADAFADAVAGVPKVGPFRVQSVPVPALRAFFQSFLSVQPTPAPTPVPSPRVGYPSYDDLRPIPTTNFGGFRPRGVTGAVEHTMVGTIESATARFKKTGMEVSATFGTGLSGRIVLWVATNRIAYHAGNWPINEEWLGNENEDGGAYWDAIRTPELYLMSGALLRAESLEFGFPLDDAHVGPHNRFSATACPDALDIPRIIAIAQGEVMYVSKEVFDATMADVNNSFQAVKDLLNPIATWVQQAPGAPRQAKQFKKALKVLDLGVRVPKIETRSSRKALKKPASAPSRTSVLAGHGKG